MRMRAWAVSIPALFFLTAAEHNAGGWAVTTVDELPDYVVAGQPLRLSYTVRQHGFELMDGLKGSVSATSGKTRIRADATPAGSRGRYAADLALPHSGDWTVRIHLGFGNNGSQLLPIPAVAPGTRPVALISPAERGRRLFVAKGCVTCHVHEAVNEKTEVPVGPVLTGRRFAAEYLRKFLADPSIKPPSQPNGERMPNLNLRASEIAALAAFINGDTRLASGAR